jgi:hypothetical protein
MNIFKQIWKSIYGPEFYAGLANQTTGASVKYFFKFLLLLALLSTIILSFIAIPIIRIALSDDSVNKVVQFYPAELNVKIKDGQFSTNMVEPYKIASIKPNEALSTSTDQISNLIVIDTKVEAVSFESFATYSTYALITKDSIVTIEDGNLQISPVARYFKSEVNINQANISSWVGKIVPVLKTLVWFLPLVIYLVMYLFGMIKLVSFFVWALLTWLILILMKKSGGYMHAYRVTIHIMTAGLILGAFFITNLFNLILLAIFIIFINFKDGLKTSAPGTPPNVIPQV